MSELRLLQRQFLFTRLVPQLLGRAHVLGYEVTFGEAYRTPAQAEANARAGTGIRNSLHVERLAIDLNLFKDGKYLTGSAAHEPLGVYWESLDELCCWGGRFGDGNHYSITYGGRK